MSGVRWRVFWRATGHALSRVRSNSPQSTSGNAGNVSRRYFARNETRIPSVRWTQVSSGRGAVLPRLRGLRGRTRAHGAARRRRGGEQAKSSVRPRGTRSRENRLFARARRAHARSLVYAAPSSERQFAREQQSLLFRTRAGSTFSQDTRAQERAPECPSRALKKRRASCLS